MDFKRNKNKLKGLFVFCSLLLLFSCGKSTEIKPIVQDIKELVFASGELKWKNTYNLTAQTDGVLQEASFDIGSKLIKGATLARIDNKTNEINVQTAENQLVISNENLTSNAPALQQLEQSIHFNESKYKQDQMQASRYERLYQSQSIAKVEYENMQLLAQNTLSQLNGLKKQYAQLQQQAKQQYNTTKGQLENNQIVQNYNRLSVPESGTVIKKLKDNGDYVKKGDIIAVVADADAVEAVLNVDENSIGKVKEGQIVYVKLNTDKNKIISGRVATILTAFDEQTQSFICKVAFDSKISNSLFGTQLEGNILIGEKKNALLLPRSYVGFGNVVNVKGKDQNTIIKTGIVSTDYVEVLSGINKNTIILPLKL
jgi:multidrug efflux pump subunit AcrA (membrane-fusion protein)